MEKVQEELEETKAEIEKLKCNLDYKECIIKQLSTANDTQRVEFSKKFEKLEEEKKELLGTIDEASEESREKVVKLKILAEESENLKAAVEVLQNKCALVKKESISPRERMLEAGDVVDELRDRVRKLEEELKWKVEQFKHLEEAHEKLRDQLGSSISDWETEKSLLVDEISRLQSSPDDLQWGRGGGVGVMGEGDVAELRHSLRVKEMECKDYEYKLKKLEKENEEVSGSLKEFQEAQIPRAVPTPSSWAKLRGKLKTLEQTHRECSANLKAKEAEWGIQREMLRSSLKVKNEAIKEMKKDLEDCNSNLTQMKMQNEELSLMLQLLRSKIGGNGEGTESGLVELMDQLEKEREEKRRELEEAGERERKLIDDLREVYNALDRTESELTEAAKEGREVELDLQNWISLAEHLRMQLDESQENRRQLEESLLDQAQVEEMMNLEAQEKDRRISNLEQQILLMDQEIRIGEDDNEDNEYDGVVDEGKEALLRRIDADEDDRLHLDLLARELEVAILAHITEERTLMHQPSLKEDGFAKENVIQQQNCSMNKAVDAIMDERSPFRELN